MPENRGGPNPRAKGLHHLVQAQHNARALVFALAKPKMINTANGNGSGKGSERRINRDANAGAKSDARSTRQQNHSLLAPETTAHL